MDTAELRQWLLTYSVALPRLLLALTTLPLLRRQVLPGLTRNAVVLVLAVLVLPVAATGLPAGSPSPAWLLGILLKEAFIGLVIGYVTSVLFWAVEAIGFFIDNQRGATMASSLNPLTEEQTSPFGILLSQVMTVLFFSGGGFLVYLGGLYQSYRVWPVASFYPAARSRRRRVFSRSTRFVDVSDRLSGGADHRRDVSWSSSAWA
ncbi:MAG: type III secretion system export apparatus subunit SctT [Candidatus Competibacteraceae bacterium]|nr:type III secretion system export apparatus subunit SctT [Candidatus Competibacteraceae bacterium]